MCDNLQQVKKPAPKGGLQCSTALVIYNSGLFEEATGMQQEKLSQLSGPCRDNK